MRRPKNDTERAALAGWRNEDAGAAMQRLRSAGYSEQQRASFLKEVAGVRDPGTLELHRDSYLAWRELPDAEKARVAVEAPRRAGRTR